MKCVELDVVENKELRMKGWGGVSMRRMVYNIDLVMSDLVCKDKLR